MNTFELYITEGDTTYLEGTFDSVTAITDYLQVAKSVGINLLHAKYDKLHLNFHKYSITPVYSSEEAYKELDDFRKPA